MLNSSYTEKPYLYKETTLKTEPDQLYRDTVGRGVIISLNRILFPTTTVAMIDQTNHLQMEPFALLKLYSLVARLLVRIYLFYHFVLETRLEHFVIFQNSFS